MTLVVVPKPISAPLALRLSASFLLLTASTVPVAIADPLCSTAQDGPRSFTSSFLPTVFVNDGTSGSFSPTSLRQAFFMVGQGAGEADAAEIKSALGACPPDDAAFADLGQTAKSLQTSSALLNVSVANGIFVDAMFPLNQEYTNALEQSWGAPVTTVDFANGAAEARQRINGFVSNNTNKIIPEILTSDPNTDTVLFLVNALYFGAKWAKPFEEAWPQKFADPARGVEAWVQMMTETMQVPLVADGGTYSAVSLPYRPADSGYEMLIVKPGGCKVDGEGEPIHLAELINGECLDSLLADAISKTNDATPVRTRVSMPRFHIEWRAEETLKTALVSLGLQRVFSPSEADLSGIPADPSAELFVSQVVHQADVKLNEQGTEAAAVTAVGISVTSMPVEPPYQFRADEPFIYSIIHRPTGSILFAGWVNMDALEVESPVSDIEETNGDISTCSSAGPACVVVDPDDVKSGENDVVEDVNGDDGMPEQQPELYKDDSTSGANTRSISVSRFLFMTTMILVSPLF